MRSDSRTNGLIPYFSPPLRHRFGRARPRPVGTPHASSRTVPVIEPTSTACLRVLIVEDDVANREVMQLVLEMAGHSVSVAATGEEALERAEQDRPDTVLLDMSLPDQSGREISAALRARGAPVPRIVITSGTPFDARDAAAIGADAILQKPFGPDRLLAVLR
ncbi:MAG: response regulator [Vicinamibacterales bacterium]